MAWPSSFDHVHMVNKGWSHEALMSMSVEEAAYWTKQQAAYDAAIAEAIRKAGEK